MEFLKLIIKLTAIFALFLSSCSKTGSRDSYEFYHWKSKAKMTPGIKEAVSHCNTKKVYLRFFDVVKEPREGIYPEYTLLELDDDFKEFEIIPVVFIANECLRSYSNADWLAEKINDLVNEMCAYHGITTTEIQLDCDWTSSTKKKFFKVVELLKKQFKVGVTIRLHQIKYPESTGVPPANKGVLMLYNVGELKDVEKNYILESSTVSAYITENSTYELPLDLALPLYNQAVILYDENSRVKQKVKLVNNPDLELISDTSMFSADNSLCYTAKKDTVFNDFQINKGTKIKIEKSEHDEIFKSLKILNSSPLKFEEVIFYHLDDSTLQRSEYKSLIEKI